MRRFLLLFSMLVTAFALAASPDQTVVVIGSAAVITDAAGNRWTITPGGLVALNGLADKTTGNVTELAYVSGKIWQENQAMLWYSKSEKAPYAPWSSGTASSPLGVQPTPSPPNRIEIITQSP